MPRRAEFVITMGIEMAEGEEVQDTIETLRNALKEDTDLAIMSAEVYEVLYDNDELELSRERVEIN